MVLGYMVPRQADCKVAHQMQVGCTEGQRTELVAPRKAMVVLRTELVARHTGLAVAAVVVDWDRYTSSCLLVSSAFFQCSSCTEHQQYSGTRQILQEDRRQIFACA
jgi:hypothetical protein